ncbi:phosphopyruvate hydratase [Candidatus Woesearchaeota archaeon CG10_big_fil_rev_8_21_14_0_10_36_11]|nr:MAG: phosphopyruvate hydratase [Candidatus Woesearchaeota archaeon CG10_big_fil_rev_8_21_14_0_10_36_11]
MSIITTITAREILDSRGNPTVEATVSTGDFSGTVSVPSGASTGDHEATELRDGGTRYNGKGVLKAIRHIKEKIAPVLQGIDCSRQREIDTVMIERDATENKHKFGANAILAVSLACAKAASESKGVPLYEYLNTFPQITKSCTLPRAFFNIINGGKHADNRLSFQEFMIVPDLKSCKKNVQAASEIYHTLKKELHKTYGKGTTNVGDEGGFAPEKMNNALDVLKILTKAIRDAGYKNKVSIAIDCAASEFFVNGKYNIDGKKLTKEQLLEYYCTLIKRYPIISIEDPFHQEDFDSFAKLRERVNIQIVGDDLTVTNIERIEAAIKEKSCTCLLLKLNQIGTLTEALDAAQKAFDAGWNVMVSHRSGETEDTFIADLAVGLGCNQIKAGAPCRGERTAKYNRLLLIEEMMKK